jgi:(R,R)-butanediol dehydrogenase/meso-butanediol dehydrogenase/diacetyl reductase
LPTFSITLPQPHLKRQFPSLNLPGLSGTGGGFSDTIAVDVKMVHPLPADIDLSLAVLIEPLAVAWHAITTTGLGLSGWKGRSVLVVGGGPVGTAVSIVLRSLGCEKVIVSEPTEVRRRQSEGIADLVINPVAENVAEKCMELTAGEGVDVVFDCAGNQRGFESGMDALRYRGCYMNVALWTGDPVCASNSTFPPLRRT